MIKPLPLASTRVEMLLYRLSRRVDPDPSTGASFSISKKSTTNLVALAAAQPIRATAFMHGLANMGGEIAKLSIPPKIEPKILFKLGQKDFLRILMRENGQLNAYRAAGQMVTKTRPKTLEGYRILLIKHKEEYGEKEDDGKLYLYRAMLKARVELFKAGEERSAVKRETGVAPAEELNRIQGIIEFIARRFPFNTSTEDKKVKSDLEIAAKRLAGMNNTAVNTMLTSVTNDLNGITDRQAVDRVRPSDAGIKDKVRYLGKGKWQVNLSNYVSTGTGLLKRVRQEQVVDTSKLISLLQHIIDSNVKEHEANAEIIKQMEKPDFDLAATRALYDSLQDIKEPKKDKARFEMETINELVTIDSAQAMGLARSLRACVVRNMKFRQRELEYIINYFERLKPEAERLIQEEINRFAVDLAGKLFDPENLSSTEGLKHVKKRLVGILGTLLKGEMREDWLKKAKSRVVGVLEALEPKKAEKPKVGIIALVEKKQEFIRRVNEQRTYYQREWLKIKKADGELSEVRAKEAKLRGEVYEKLRRNIKVLEKIDQALAKRLQKAALYILKAEYEYQAYVKVVASEKEYEDKQGPLLKSFGDILSHLIKVTDHGGVELGRATIEDASAMQLKFNLADL